jgi:osmoprotectant transport system substrate-binding protein
MHRPRLLIPAAALAAATLLAACGASTSTASNGSTTTPPSTAAAGAQPHVVIGSANFPENVILADIYADVLRSKGVPVTTHLDIGSREVYFKELENGVLNVFPEYNGALLNYLDPSATASSTAAVDAALAKQLPSNLEALQPAAAQDKDSVTVTQAFAAKYHLSSIPQLRPIEKQIVFGGPPEFATREEGLIGLERIYGIVFKGFKGLDEAGPLTIAALKDGTVQAADIFTTDPSITKDHFVALADPKNLFAAQNVTPIVNKKVATPTVVAALDSVSAALTTSDLEQLVAGVELDRVDPATVAADFVKQAGLG